MAESGAAVEAFMEGVSESLTEAGHATPAFLDRARDTLRAVATDEELQGELAAGRIVADHEPVGFGSAAGEIKTPRKQKREDPAEKRRRKQASARVERARAAVEKADDAVDDARLRLRAAEEERVRRAEQLEAAEAALDS